MPGLATWDYVRRGGVNVAAQNVGLVDVDSKIPNLALMKLSAYHKAMGDDVSFFDPMFSKPDKIYASKVFTYTDDYKYYPEGIEIIKGGTGYDINGSLPDEIESLCPDYSLYPNLDHSMGFLTRGCPRHCSWCFVPKKEGTIRPAGDIEDFLRHGTAILLDNNVLACEHGIRQIEKIAKLGVKVDFNQGLDARLIDDSVARLLAGVKWLEPVRLACDTREMIPVVHRAVELLRWHNVTPRRYSCYVLLTDDIDDALDRIRFLKGLNVGPFVQPFIPPSGKTAPKIQRQMARWANHRAVFNSTTWEDYTG